MDSASLDAVHQLCVAVTACWRDKLSEIYNQMYRSGPRTHYCRLCSDEAMLGVVHLLGYHLVSVL